jgi:hypothetical protein
MRRIWKMFGPPGKSARYYNGSLDAKSSYAIVCAIASIAVFAAIYGSFILIDKCFLINHSHPSTHLDKSAINPNRLPCYPLRLLTC